MQHPTAAWTAQQITEAFPGDATVPRYLHRDRDATYGDVFRQRVAPRRAAPRVSTRGLSYWPAAWHPVSVLREYIAYYNASRCHQSRLAERHDVVEAFARSIVTIEARMGLRDGQVC